MKQYRGSYPRKTEIMAAPNVVVELQRFVDYTALLGASAPPAATVASSLSAAVKWGVLRSSTDAWSNYVRAEYAMAWQTANTLLDEVKPLFFIALAKNSLLATLYPSLTQLFNASKVSARQAATTKKKAAKAAAEAAASAAKEAATRTTTPTQQAAQAAPAPTKAVTVNA
jgi:hypothetical protein